MSRSDKSAWLEGPGDLREADVEDVPVKGSTVRVRGLPAAYSNEATSEALEWKTWPNGDTTSTINTAKLEELQFAYGCVEPTFSAEEARAVSRKFGPAFKKVVAKIDELSGVDKEAITEANRRFQGSGEAEEGGTSRNGASAGSGEPDVPVRDGAGVPDAAE